MKTNRLICWGKILIIIGVILTGNGCDGPKKTPTRKNPAQDLFSSNYLVRLSAAKKFSEKPTPEALSGLIKCLQAPEESLRLFAAKGLESCMIRILSNLY